MPAHTDNAVAHRLEQVEELRLGEAQVRVRRLRLLGPPGPPGRHCPGVDVDVEPVQQKSMAMRDGKTPAIYLICVP